MKRRRFACPARVSRPPAGAAVVAARCRFRGTVPADGHVAPRMCMPHNVAPMTLFKANAGAKGLPAATLTGRSIRNPP